jgi:hypothetical protein
VPKRTNRTGPKEVVRWLVISSAATLVSALVIALVPIARPVVFSVGPISVGGLCGDDRVLTAYAPGPAAQLSLMAAAQSMPGMHFTRVSMGSSLDAWWWTLRIGRLRWAVLWWR